MVMELVEGSTLADRLRHGPLSVPDALAVARQIAAALDEAHERGIVHRDLKPANIVLQTSSGIGSGDARVKVLDFGLAKPVIAGHEGDVTHDLRSFDQSVEGQIIGTPAYMSPEQARGLPVDKRTDIWAFGCVLYEMLTGRRAFEGGTTTDTLARILEHEPDWSALPAATPATIRTLLDGCLRKDPRKRLHDIADAVIDINDRTAPVDSRAAGLASADCRSERAPTPGVDRVRRDRRSHPDWSGADLSARFAQHADRARRVRRRPARRVALRRNVTRVCDIARWPSAGVCRHVAGRGIVVGPHALCD